MNAAQQMQQEINAYFLAEKYESLLFVFVGIAAIGASVWLWKSASAFAATFRPMSLPAYRGGGYSNRCRRRGVFAHRPADGGFVGAGGGKSRGV